MKVQSCSSTIFQSKAYPIKPYIMEAGRCPLTVTEATIKQFKRKNFVRSLSHFFCRNFASMTNDPGWLSYSGNSLKRDCPVFKTFYESMRRRLLKKDDSMTLLIARDSHNRIKGACLAYKCDVFPETQENLCYIDSLAVEKDCRGFGLARSMMEKIMESHKDRFSDVFLTGERMAEGFYKKLGFRTISGADKDEKAVIDYIEGERFDYPKYVDLFTKRIKKNSPEWYKDIAEKLNFYN